MRSTIYFSKKLIFILIFLVLGIAFTADGAASLVKARHAVNVIELSKTNCYKGRYVAGEIRSYVVKDIQNLGGGSTSGISDVFYSGAREYSVFTVPIDGGSYIRIMVSDQTTLEQLASLKEQTGGSVYIEGEMIDAPIAVNDKWYEDMKDASFSSENVLADYVIKEKALNADGKKLCIGFALLICAGLLYFFKHEPLVQMVKH